jgi:hypothetical protein
MSLRFDDWIWSRLFQSAKANRPSYLSMPPIQLVVHEKRRERGREECMTAERERERVI